MVVAVVLACVVQVSSYYVVGVVAVRYGVVTAAG